MHVQPQRHLRALVLADIAPHRRLVILRRSRERFRGRFPLPLHNLHQPLPQAYIAQPGAAEFVLGPHVRSQLAAASEVPW